MGVSSGQGSGMGTGHFKEAPTGRGVLQTDRDAKERSGFGVDLEPSCKIKRLFGPSQAPTPPPPDGASAVGRGRHPSYPPPPGR